MDQLRMFRLAVEAIHLQCSYVAGEGWRLTVGYRRQDEPWSSAYRAQYSHMSSSELYDVLTEEAARALTQNT